MDSVQLAGTDLSLESDEDLLVFMTMREDDLTVANAAFAEFYQRHVSYIFRTCRRVTKGILDEAGAWDLVQETFLRANDRAATFNADGITDPERLKNRTRAWLGRIAVNIFRDVLRGRVGVREISLDDHEIATEPQPLSPSSPSANRQLLDEAIESLSEKEQRVLRITFQYYQPGKKYQRLPNDVAEDLAKELGTTSNNVRQMRRRALRKITEYIKSKANLKNS